MINELILLNLSPDQRLIERGQLCPSKMGTSSMFCLGDHPQALCVCPSVHVRYFKAFLAVYSFELSTPEAC